MGGPPRGKCWSPSPPIFYLIFSIKNCLNSRKVFLPNLFGVQSIDARSYKLLSQFNQVNYYFIVVLVLSIKYCKFWIRDSLCFLCYSFRSYSWALTFSRHLSIFNYFRSIFATTLQVTSTGQFFSVYKVRAFYMLIYAVD